jgi:hypothetical protein
MIEIKTLPNELKLFLKWIKNILTCSNFSSILLATVDREFKLFDISAKSGFHSNLFPFGLDSIDEMSFSFEASFDVEMWLALGVRVSKQILWNDLQII